MRKRILSVIGDLGFGGGENRLLALARNIDRKRFEHTVITINQEDPDREETCAMRRHYAEAGVELKDLGEGPSSGGASRAGHKAARLMRRVMRCHQAARYRCSRCPPGTGRARWGHGGGDHA